MKAFEVFLRLISLWLLASTGATYSRPQIVSTDSSTTLISTAVCFFQQPAIPGENTRRHPQLSLKSQRHPFSIQYKFCEPDPVPINLLYFGTHGLPATQPSLKQIACFTPLDASILPWSSLILPSSSSSAQRQSSSLLKWLGLGAFWWAAFFDHYQDAIQDAPNHQSYIFNANYRHWHFIKNLAHLGYLTSGFAAGMEFGQRKVTIKRYAVRMIGSVMIYWFIQNIVYDKSLHNVWFDYKRQYRNDGIVIFDLHGRDHRIELSKWARPILDVVRVAGGLYLVIKN